MTLDSSNLGRLRRVNDVRKVWASESAEFTPWLAENIDVLAAELGMTLTVMTREVPVGEFRLDILAKDDTGRTVVIENQLASSDHGHLGQSLVYAAGLDAAAVVWVCTRFREDHRSVLDWLNERTDSGVGFFGVEVTVVQIGENSVRAPVFTVVSRPNDWQKSIKTSEKGDAESVNPVNAERQDFLAEVLAAANAQRRGINIAARSSYNWLSFAFGGFGNWGLSIANGQLRVEAYLDLKEHAPTKYLFDQVAAESEQWEAQIGAGALQWERLDDKRACRIAAYRPVDLNDDTDRSAAVDWCITTLIAMYDALDSHLRAAATTARVATAELDGVESLAADNEALSAEDVLGGM